MSLIKYIAKSLSITLLVTTALCSLSFAQSTKQTKPVAVNDTLAIFEKLSNQIKDAKGDYTLGGTIDLTDPVNPVNSIKNTEFLFCKRGNEFYYKLGTTETINAGTLYICIDHQTHNILVSPKKQVVYDVSPLKPIDIGEAMHSEHYQLVSTTKGEEQTISLVNEHHISCKQYSLTFTREGLHIKRLYMRLTYMNDPMNKAKETTVDVHISQWVHSANLAHYLTTGQVLRSTRAGWRGINEFKDYRVVEM